MHGEGKVREKRLLGEGREKKGGRQAEVKERETTGDEYRKKAGRREDNDMKTTGRRQQEESS